MSLRPSVFVTRDLSPDSPLWSQLTGAGYLLSARSLLRFEPVPFDPPAPTDWIFFYSSRAVTYFLDGLAIPPDATVHLATMGSGTAATLRDRLRKADFVGSGRPPEVARVFADRLGAGVSVLFPRARRSRRSVQDRLPTRINVVDLIVYDNAIATELPVPGTDIAVLTSPLNAEAYLAATAQPAPQLVAIGASTERFLLAQGHRCVTATTPDEASLVKLILSLPEGK